MEKIKITHSISLSLVLLFSWSLYSQTYSKRDHMHIYRKWGLFFSFNRFEQAKTYEEYGNQLVKMNNDTRLGQSYGLSYDFYQKNNWIFSSIFHMGLQHVFSHSFTISTKEFANSISPLIISVPLASDSYKPSYDLRFTANYHIFISRSNLLRITGGIKLMYFSDKSSPYLTASYEDKISPEIIFYKTKIQRLNGPFYGSIVIGAGMSWGSDRLQLQTNLVYILNLQDIYQEKYLFTNLVTSPDFGATQRVSGNYLSLQFVLKLIKPRKKLEQYKQAIKESPFIHTIQ